MHEKYMKIALEEAKKSLEHDDIPVGAIIVYKDKIICKAHNKKELNKDATQHAEILAIKAACHYMNSWYLNECTLYVTMEPCLMCAGAILQSRIKQVVYSTKNPKFGYIDSIDSILNYSKNNHKVEIISGICEQESSDLLKSFFKDKRG